MGWNHAATSTLLEVSRSCMTEAMSYIMCTPSSYFTIIFHCTCTSRIHPPHIYVSSSFLQLQHFRRTQRGGSSDQMASTAKSALICMVLLAAVMAVHGVSVSVKNQTPVNINVNGVDIAAGVTAVVNVTQSALGLVLKLVNSLGQEITSSVDLPLGVTEVILNQVLGGIQVTVGAVTTTVIGLLGGLVNSLLGLVLATIPL